MQTPGQQLDGEETVEALLEALVAEVQQEAHKVQEVPQIIIMQPMVVLDKGEMDIVLNLKVMEQAVVEATTEEVVVNIVAQVVVEVHLI